MTQRTSSKATDLTVSTEANRGTNSWQNQLIFWSVVILLLLGFLWAFNTTVLPFLIGISIAYLLNPVVEYLAKYKIPRRVSAIILIATFGLVLLGILGAAIPILYKEVIRLSDNLPIYIDRLWQMLNTHTTWIENKIGADQLDSVKETLKNNLGKAATLSAGVLGTVFQGGQFLISVFTILILSPIVAFFMIKEWPAAVHYVDNLIPRQHYDSVRDLLRDINSKVAGFVRGQLSIALALGVIYALALTIAGLNYGFLIGMAAGLLSIIPLVGSTVGLLVSVLVAWFQTGEFSYVGIIAAIFLVGQFVEGNILSPKLLGDKVGMHPLWVIFAVMAGGQVYGIVGMLLAVPVTASIGVLVSFFIEKYKKSAYFKQTSSETQQKRVRTKESVKKSKTSKTAKATKATKAKPAKTKPEKANS